MDLLSDIGVIYVLAVLIAAALAFRLSKGGGRRTVVIAVAVLVALVVTTVTILIWAEPWYSVELVAL